MKVPPLPTAALTLAALTLAVLSLAAIPTEAVVRRAQRPARRRSASPECDRAVLDIRR